MQRETVLKKKTYMAFAGIGIIVFALIYVMLVLTKGGVKEVTTENAPKVLQDKLKKIDYKEMTLVKGNASLGGSDLAEELPDIEKYPLTVRGDSDLNIEIFCSPEKAGEGNDGWLNEMAEDFNAKKLELNGKTASVSIRSISSGLGMDYIISGKYLPDAYTPSNELWGEMMASKGIEIELASEKLVGNVAGILLAQDKKEQIIEKYGEVSIKTVTRATADGLIAMGYTNPLQSSTGLNFLLSTLYAYDNANPFSEAAIKAFDSFQANVPFVAYTTLQMREAVDSGSFDGLILEYQTYKNTRELRSYDFTPFGIRHDNPVYSIGTLDEDKSAVLKAFMEFCMETGNQEKATSYGFNEMDSYVSEVSSIQGNKILEAQDLWKENKDSGRPVTAVFVADISGSMDGSPINELKESLMVGSKYISSQNYIGLVSYDSDVYVNLPINKFDITQRSYFAGAINSLSAAGGTATYDAMLVATDMLLKAKEANPNTKLMLFVLSDGQANAGNSLNDIRGLVKAFNIPVYTIAYGEGADIDELKDISGINEAASINADTDDVIYKLKSLFNAQM